MIIEQAVIQHLLEYIDHVYPEEPEKPPDTYVLVEKTGSSRSDTINRSTIAVQSYAPTFLRMIELNEIVKEAMEHLIELDTIGSCRLNSDYNFTDPETRRYRYQAVFDITHY